MNILCKINRYGTSLGIFVISYALIFAFVTLIRDLVFSYLPAISKVLLSLRTPSLILGLQFNLLGSVLPILISIYLMAKLRKYVKINIGFIEIFFLICCLAITILSVYLPITPVDNNGSYGNVLYLALFLGVSFYYIEMENFQLAMPLAYITGTLGGILNDVTATLGPSHLIGIFGGLSIFDLDFVFPLSLLFAVWFMAKINSSLRGMYTRYNRIFGIDE